ncbi:Gp37-like protein [Segeticoccus rhizosphaerae]|uniref:Gp37-like protein n=1 Tax=Segeticoccus rhizosphaerae TaxID=1104777 RepID=UPI0013968915|nr:hypothetical protein [Segeticoccus rhizosphaerae]
MSRHSKIPLELTIWDKNLTPLGVIDNPRTAVVNMRRNAQGTGQLTIPTSHRHYDKLRGTGTRLTVKHAESGEQVMSGPFTLWQGSAGRKGEVTLQLADDWALFAAILGWQDPTATLSSTVSSTMSPAYYTSTGPAETVVKDLVTKNAITRLGLPVVCAPDQGRGDTITVKVRMHPLADRLFPKVTDAGLTVTVKQDGGNGLVVDVSEPRDYPVTITEKSGIVTDWQWTQGAPEVTRAIAGGQGDGTARKWLQSIDATAEAEWGPLFVREQVVDASDLDNDTDLADRAVERRREGRRKTGLAMTFAENQTFRYGQHLWLGDNVTETLSSGAPLQHTLSEVTMTWTYDHDSATGGFRVTPSVGEIDATGTISRWVANALGRMLKSERFYGSSQ